MADGRYTALVTDDAFSDFSIERGVLEPIGCTVVAPQREEADALVPEADALLVSRANIDEQFIERARALKVIARYGVGVENIDVEAAERRGVVVVNVPDYCVHEVAEHVIAQIFACSRQLVRLDRIVRGGRWSPSDIRPTGRVAGQTLGLVGLGLIGRAVAARATALGLEVVAHDPWATSADGIELVDLDELLRRADFVSLHVPLTDATRNLIGAEEIASMKQSAFLINSARGGVVDEHALADALRSGGIEGAALDVLSVEPPPADHPLLGLENVVFTPHVAFYSTEAVRERKLKVALGVRAVLEGRQPASTVTAHQTR